MILIRRVRECIGIGFVVGQLSLCASPIAKMATAPTSICQKLSVPPGFLGAGYMFC
jgi:hypothetical protein